MNYQSGQFRTLEARFERLLLDLAAAQAAIANLQTQIAGLQQGGSGQGQSGGGGTVFFIQPIVIAAGGNQTGLTIYTLIAGTLTATGTTNATIYNGMAAATNATAGKNIIVGPNPDGTWSTITQSC